MTTVHDTPKTSLRAGLLCLAALVAGCDGSAPGEGGKTTATSPEAGPATVQITVVGTSDLHGRLSTLSTLGGYLAELRKRNPDGVVLVDAGDMFQGTIESNLDEGKTVIEAYKKLGYDAAAIGNHEFDYGPAGPAATPKKGANEGPDADARGALKARAADAQGAFPLLAANILEGGKPLAWPNVAPRVIVKRHGISVGIIGVSTMQTPSTTIAANVVGITMKPIAKAIVDEAKALRDEGADVVVVTAHAGGACKSFEAPADLSSCEADAEIFEVARALPRGTVHAIVAGHTHQSVAHEVAGIPVLQSGAYGMKLGRVDLVIDTSTKKVVRHVIHPPEVVKDGGKLGGAELWPSAAVEEVVSRAVDRAQVVRSEKLGAALDAPFTAKYREESAVGNLVTSLLLEVEPKADVALANGGGLRADLPAGELTYGALYEVLPFDNRLATMTMKGRTFRETIEQNLRGKGGILSLAGARVAARCEGGELRVDVFLTRRGKAEKKLRDDDEISIVTSEFLATRGDGMSPGEKVVIDEDGPPFRDLVAGVIRKKRGTFELREWLSAERPRMSLPGPIGPSICGPGK